jgi:hypothetical protein
VKKHRKKKMAREKEINLKGRKGATEALLDPAPPDYKP